MYGNVAVPLEAKDRKKDTPEDHTHKWTVFVRDPNNPNEDLSYFIKKVIFKLHDTYTQPSRSIEKPPFEVTETGWGEFEITIRIFFLTSAGEKNVQLYHHLKLHPYGPNAPPPPPPNPDGSIPKPVPQAVESYVYDELVFNEPTEPMFEALTSRPGALLPAHKSKDNKYTLQTEAEELERLSSGLESVYQQVQLVKERIQQLEREKEQLQVKPSS